ncbi:hypothetical protein BDN71DRAFT_1429333 [Pleurotus eryngii]|uniref:DUF6532 domain-containing protein n=1 Tax=Pleurotus eryngii TaxID=5323 RepID=A0A9P6DH80_PLEER|nr:hypothetical protein BDN71DRAFT_1429333 [Pleurotus eryngii]
MTRKNKHALIPLATSNHPQTRSHNNGLQLGILSTKEVDSDEASQPNLGTKTATKEVQGLRKSQQDGLSSLSVEHASKKVKLLGPAKPWHDADIDDGDNKLNEDGDTGSDVQSDDSQAEDELDDGSDIEVQAYEVNCYSTLPSSSEFDTSRFPKLSQDDDDASDDVFTAPDLPRATTTKSNRKMKPVNHTNSWRVGDLAASAKRGGREHTMLEEGSKATMKQASWERKGANETAIVQPSHWSINDAGDDYRDSIFLPCSDIVLTCLNGGGKRVDMSSQSVVMQGVLHQAILIGWRYLGFGCNNLHADITTDNVMEMVAPFSPNGLADYSYHALVEAATVLGHEGIMDIISNFYKKPLVTLVSHRLGLTRTAIKKSMEQLVHIHCSFASSGIDTLLADHSYIYPQKEGGRFDQGKLFRANIVIPALSAAFFGPDGLGILYPKWFMSSCKDLKHEHEITMPMMAMCMTLVEICLREYQMKTRIKLKGSGYDSIFRTHMARRQKYYHELMHSALQSARTNTIQMDVEVTGEELLSSIDWDQVAVNED